MAKKAEKHCLICGKLLKKEPGAVNYPNTGGIVLRGLETLLKPATAPLFLKYFK